LLPPYFIGKINKKVKKFNQKKKLF